MVYFQKIIIKSNRVLDRIYWSQHDDKLYLDKETNFYRKFNHYTHDQVSLYFNDTYDTYTCNFQIGPKYNATLELLIQFYDNDDNEDNYNLFINGQCIF
jgi:hypothetical protein